MNRMKRSLLFIFIGILACCQLAYGYCSFSGGTGPVKTPLMVAIWQGNLETVSRLTSREINLDLKFRYCGSEGHETTPLLNAVEGASLSRSGDSHKHEKVVEFLLVHGASPDFAIRGFSPLHAAASLGNLSMVRLLLRYGARVDLRDDRNHETPLLVAARSGAVKIAQALIAAGSDVNALDSLGGNAVAIAAGAKQEESVKLFISQGVDPCARDREERNALYWAHFGSDGDPQKLRIVALLQARCGQLRSTGSAGGDGGISHPGQR